LEKIILRKAKGAYVKDIKHNLFYEFDKNINILGHSHKKLTTIAKNNISSSWNLTGNTIYHARIRKLFSRLFPGQYNIYSSFSLEEIFLKLYIYSEKNSCSLELFYDNFCSWLTKKCGLDLKNKSSGKKIIVYDMAQIFLDAKGDMENFNQAVSGLKKGNITVFNYFWFPYPEISSDNADMIILPEIFSGNFKYVNMLIDKKLEKDLNLFHAIEEVPSLYISSSLKAYYIIKSITEGLTARLDWKNFIQAKRLFVYEHPEEPSYREVMEKFKGEKIFLNQDPPYYNYLPINLLEHQKKKLSRIQI
jgi:hypothetical protein